MILDQAARLIRHQVRTSAALRAQYRHKLQATRSHVEATQLAWEQAQQEHGLGSDEANAAHETWIRATVALEQLRERLFATAGSSSEDG
jgi:acetyl-CoA carboxylase carboxyltransferase component